MRTAIGTIPALVQSRPARRSPVLPLGRVLRFSLVVAAAGGFLLSSSAVAGAFLTLILVMGMLWRVGEPPIFPIGLAYQWVQISAPLVFLKLYAITGGRTPLGDVSGDVHGAVMLSLIGLACLTLGIRLSYSLLRVDQSLASASTRDAGCRSDPKLLFLFVMIVFAPDWFMDVRGTILRLGAPQIPVAVLAFRMVLFAWLWFAVLERRSGYTYAFGALLYVVIPMLISGRFALTGPVLIILVAILAHWTPAGGRRSRVGSRTRYLWGAALLGAGLVLAAMAWQAGIKGIWRWSAPTGTVVQRITAFRQIASNVVARMSYAEAAQSVVARVSSSYLFAHVLQRVPEIVPHTNGALTFEALQHVTHPRILFPDKPNLGSGSEIPMTYAGVPVREGTSVSVGYMAEFYIDFGIPWMFLPIVLYGMLFGALYVALLRVTPSLMLFRAGATAMFLSTITSYEGNFTKDLGGQLTIAAVFLAIVAWLGPSMNRWVSVRSHLRQSQPPVSAHWRAAVPL